MSEDSIFIVKVKQYMYLCTSVLKRRQKDKNSFNIVCSVASFPPWCNILSSPHGIIMWFCHLIFALQIFRINLRMPPPVGGREFLRFHIVKVLTFSWCLKYQKALKCLRKLAIFQTNSHTCNDELNFILKIITNTCIELTCTLLHETQINRDRREFVI